MKNNLGLCPIKYQKTHHLRGFTFKSDRAILDHMKPHTAIAYAFLKPTQGNIFQEKIVQALIYLELEVQQASPQAHTQGDNQELSVLLKGDRATLDLAAQAKGQNNFLSSFQNIADIQIAEQGNQFVLVRFYSKGFLPNSYSGS